MTTTECLQPPPLQPGIKRREAPIFFLPQNLLIFFAWLCCFLFPSKKNFRTSLFHLEFHSQLEYVKFPSIVSRYWSKSKKQLSHKSSQVEILITFFSVFSPLKFKSWCIDYNVAVATAGAWILIHARVTLGITLLSTRTCSARLKTRAERQNPKSFFPPKQISLPSPKKNME